MGTNCNYHNNQKAIWSCDICARDFCNNCIKKPNEFEPPRCPLCRNQLHSMSIAGLTQPVLSKLLEYFVQSAITLKGIILWGFAIIFSLIPDSAAGNILFFVTAIFFIVTIYQFMLQMASNNKLLFQLDFSRQQELFNFLIIYIGGWLIFDSLYQNENKLTLAFLILSSLLIPAFTIVRLTEDSLSSSLSFRKVLDTIKVLKPNYFTPALTLSITVILSISCKGFLNNEDNLLISKTLVHGLLLHSVNAVFLTFGYLVYHHYYELGFSVCNTSLLDLNRKSPLSIFSEIEIFTKEKRLDEAKQELFNIIRNTPENLEAHKKLASILLQERSQPQFQKTLDIYLTDLINTGQQILAANCFHNIFKNNQKALPSSLDVVEVIVKHWFTPVNYKSAILLIEEFLKKNQGSIDCNALQNIHAEILAEFNNNTLDSKSFKQYS